MPLSLIGTFAAMWLLNYSLDNLSLMALIVATGFVVDDAIVVLENIMRHVEAGTTRKAPLFRACCATRTTMGAPPRSARGLSGRRVEARPGGQGSAP